MIYHSPETLEKVRDLYVLQGRSASETAMALSLVSRNSVLSIVHRMLKRGVEGWVRKPELGITNSNNARRQNLKMGRAPGNAKMRAARAVLPQAPRPFKAAAPMPRQVAPVPLMDRQMLTQCAAIVSDDGAAVPMVCGAPIDHGSYCAAHCSQFFVAPQRGLMKLAGLR